MLLLLAFQIISGHLWACYYSYPGIPTLRCKGGLLHSEFVGLTCMQRVCLYLKGAREGEQSGSGISVLGDGGSASWSAQREPSASRRLLTTFSLMDNHIGENLIELQWPQPIENKFSFITFDLIDRFWCNLFWLNVLILPQKKLNNSRKSKTAHSEFREFLEKWHAYFTTYFFKNILLFVYIKTTPLEFHLGPRPAPLAHCLPNWPIRLWPCAPIDPLNKLSHKQKMLENWSIRNKVMVDWIL